VETGWNESWSQPDVRERQEPADAQAKYKWSVDMSKGGPRDAGHHSTRKGNAVKVELRNGQTVEGTFLQKNDRHCILTVNGKRWRKAWKYIAVFRVTERLPKEAPVTIAPVMKRKSMWTEAEIGETISSLVQGQRPEDIAKRMGRDQSIVYNWKKWLAGKEEIPHRQWQRVPSQLRNKFPQASQPAVAAPIIGSPPKTKPTTTLSDLEKSLDAASHEVMAIAEDIEKLEVAISAINEANLLLSRASKIGEVVDGVQKQMAAAIGAL